MGIPSPCVSVTVKLRQSLLIEAIVALLFGGVAKDGGGWAVVNGVWIPVDPGPLLRVFSASSQDLQDMLIGQSIARLAWFLNDAAVGRTVRELVLRMEAGEQGQDESQPRRSSGSQRVQSAIFLVFGIAVGVLAALFSSKLL